MVDDHEYKQDTWMDIPSERDFNVFSLNHLAQPRTA